MISYISREDLQKCIDQLDQALHNHQQWYSDLTRTLICRLPADEHDVNPSAYQACRFGQWYHGDSIPGKLREHPGFIAIGEEHQRMHKLCTQLLDQNKNSSIKVIDYDKFANTLERMRLEIFALRREMDEVLYNHDPLTGAITRISMLSILREQQELIRREGQSCCISMLDIDLFKKINDQYGHVAGDRVLVALVEYCIKNIRPYDKIFRYGGEEFLICMQHADLTLCSDMMGRLQRGIADLDIDIGLGKPIRVTISMGITSLDANTSIEESIEHADKALYEAKSDGRNCLRVWKK